MTRIIKASEVKPGQRIHWTEDGTTRELTVVQVCQGGCTKPSMQFRNDAGRYEYAALDAEVTVLSEPAPPQPEEPTEFGARVVADGRRFLRAPSPSSDPIPWLSDSDDEWHNWAAILAMGPVQVVPDQGWTVPADTPEVPERIEEWPEDDTALRKHEWRDSSGRFWQSLGEGDWRFEVGPDTWSFSYPRPYRGPWTRETDA